MAALVQTYTQDPSTITMLQTRPTSSTGRMPSGQQQPALSYAAVAQAPRSAYNGGYRGSSTPIQQYAFTSTPSLNQLPPLQQPTSHRTSPTQEYSPNVARGRFPAQTHVANNPNTSAGQLGSRDDLSIGQGGNGASSSRSQSAHLGSGKVAPDRYRRPGNNQAGPHARSQSVTLPSTANLPNMAQFYGISNNSRTTLPARPTSFYATVPGSSMDDMHIPQQPKIDAKGLRRRSMQGLDSSSVLQLPQFDHSLKLGVDDSSLSPAVSGTAHSRNGSSESVNSSRSNHSRPSSANRSVSAPTANPSSPSGDEIASAAKTEQQKQPNVSTRGSPSDAAKRTLNPSPLSKPATMATDSADAAPPSAASGNLSTPAAKQLAAINQKGTKAKSKTSRLRRAFSFGSAADFRKAAGSEVENGDKSEPGKLHKEPTPEEAYDAEQARIAEAQEAAGLGTSIYGGRLFGGSTDNLSISSTASSASIMIRKMGRGMKKSTRSLAGLFRPKSVVGVPPPEPLAPETSQASVSMVTVEAETQRVNVSAEPQTADNFPHLERNSLDASQAADLGHDRLGSSGTDKSNSRKSIVGGDRERAEVLAAVRKGILKRSSSPSIRPVEGPSGLDLPSVPAITDSPNSSAPSTPNDEAQGHRRTGSVALGSEDYFMTALRLRQDSKSAPGTPQGTLKRNATFSPRLIFHDTWPPQEYDRRGEVATCNRLTPLLAQQIKEELNTFKMEMEVHENSKIYTHFF